MSTARGSLPSTLDARVATVVPEVSYSSQREVAPHLSQRAQPACAGTSRQMGGMWQTNRFFVRRQFS